MVENDEYSYIIRVLKEVMIKSTSVMYAEFSGLFDIQYAVVAVVGGGQYILVCGGSGGW